MDSVINFLAIWSIFIDRGRKTVCRSKSDLLLRRNHLGRHKLDTLGQLLVALDAATYLVAGTSLEQYQPRFHVKTWNWPRVMTLGMVISILIGQSACLLPKSATSLAHGRASETERIWVDNEGLSNLRRLKIQSTPYGNIGDKVRIFELVEKATTLLA